MKSAPLAFLLTLAGWLLIAVFRLQSPRAALALHHKDANDRGLTAMSRRLCALVGLLLTLLPCAASAAPAAQGSPDPRFGVIEAYTAPGQASTLGAGWERVTFDWNQIQPNGPQDWVEYPVADAVLDAERASGREVVGLLVATPGWATDWGRGAGVPNGLYLAPDDPNNTWAVFVRAMVTRHQGRIHHWIIWNEPDIWQSGYQSWGGSVEDFAQLLRVAYTVAHQVDPNAVIHLPAVTHWWDVNYGRELFMRRLLQVLVWQDPGAANNNYYFDAFTLHLYFNADTIYDLSSFYYALMAEFGIYKPLWIVETNAPPSNDPAWPVPNPQFLVTQEDQAAFVVQGFAMALAAGAQRVAFYKLVDLQSDSVNPEPFGLVRLDGTRRPAFTAYQTATRYLAGFQRATLDRRDDAAVVTVERSSGWTTVLWARGGALTVQVPAHTSSGRLVDWRGNARGIAAQGGLYTVELPGSPCTQAANPCLIGGAPYLLVEGSAPAGPPPAPVETSAATAVPTPTPWLDGVTATPTAESQRTPAPSATPTATATPSPTRTPRPTRTPTPTATVTPAPTPTATASPTATALPTPTPTTSAPAPTPPETPAGTLVSLIGGALLIIALVRLKGRAR